MGVFMLSLASSATGVVESICGFGWGRCHRVVATVLVGEGLLVRRMLTVQDRAAIAKGLQEGCSLRRTADRIVWIGVRGISRGIRRNGGKCGYQPVTADVKAQKRRSRPKTRKIDADPVLKARVLADLKRSRTPRQIVAGTPGGGL